MAKDSGGAGGSRKGGSRVPQWNDVAKSDPHSIPGTNSYRPPGSAERERQASAEYERLNLTKLTPYRTPSVSSLASLPSGSREASAAMAVSQDYPAADAKAASSFSRSEDAKEKEEKPKTRRAYEMSWEDYTALSDAQRAAVDFNTLLVRAREQDLQSKNPGDGPSREKYDKVVEQMFGEGRGSETYAPNTVALLDKVGFKGSGEDDLDNFLALKSAISEKELANLDITPAAEMDVPAMQLLPGVETKGFEVEAFATPEAQVTAAMQESLAKGSQMLQSFRRLEKADPKEEAYFKFGVDALARADHMGGDLNLILQDLNTQLDTPQKKQQFVQYAASRGDYAEQRGLPLVEGFDTISSEEYRSLLDQLQGGE